MKTLLILMLVGINTEGYSKPKVSKVQFTFGNLINKRLSYIPEFNNHENFFSDSDLERWAYESIIEVDVDYNKMYFNNDIIGYVTNRNYRYISWDFEIGYNLGKVIKLYYHHKSEHVMELERDTKYPLHDSVGFKLCLIGNKCND